MIRPELMARVRWMSEPLAWGAVLLALVWVLLRMIPTVHWLVLILPLGLTVGAAIAFWNACMRLRLSPNGEGEGVVLIDERRIGYFGPGDGGGFVDLDALMRLEIRGAPQDKSWILYHEDGPPLVISQNAPGAEQLLDTFSALSGLGLSRFASVLEANDDLPEVLWERAKGESRILH